MSNTAVLVFAKNPVPGQVKTRLTPALSAHQAAALHLCLVEVALSAAVASGLGPVTLCRAPGPGGGRLQALARRFGVADAQQVGADLGERMGHALAWALASHPRALLMGSDCPTLGASDLRQADAALRDGFPAVFVPAVDGGYVLVGARRAHAELFRGIPWSTGRVMETTRERLRGLGWRWAELTPRRDVDRPQDLDLLPDDVLRCALSRQIFDLPNPR